MKENRKRTVLTAAAVLASIPWAAEFFSPGRGSPVSQARPALAGNVELVSTIEELENCAAAGGFKTCEIVQNLRGENTSGNMIDYALPPGSHDLTVSCAPGVKVEWKPSGTPTGYVKIWHVDMTRADAGSRHRIRDCVVEELGGGRTAVAGVVYTNTQQDPARQTVFRIEDSRITTRSVGEAEGASTYEAACGTGRDHGVKQGVTRVELVDSECTSRSIALSLFNDCDPQCPRQWNPVRH